MQSKKKQKNKILTSAMLIALVSCYRPVSFPIIDYAIDENDTKIIIASDTHYLASKYLDPKRDYDSENFLRDGRTMNYNNIVFDHLLNNVIAEKPDYFIITGDLTYNGSRESHLELASKLKTLLEYDIQPLVIPGNHDTYIMNSRDYSSKEYNIVESITYEDFKNIYAECGFNNAVYQDEETLSYIYKTKNDEYLLMLDTTNNRFNYEYDMHLVSGSFFSLDFLNNFFKENKGCKALSFSHHNLITHHKSFEKNYTISNAEELRNIYQENDVKLNFSGHLHIQNTKEKDGIYDICTGSLVDYSSRYGVLHIAKEGYQYRAKSVDFELEEMMFSEYTFDLFTNKYIKLLEEKNEKYKQYLGKVNTYYFDGTLFLHQELMKGRFYRKIKKSDNAYMKSIIEEFNYNHLNINVAF